MITPELLEKRIKETTYFLQKINKEDEPPDFQYTFAILFNVLLPLICVTKKINAELYNVDIKTIEKIEKAAIDEIKEFFHWQKKVSLKKEQKNDRK